MSKNKHSFFADDCKILNFILENIPIDATVLYVVDTIKDSTFANIMSINGHNVETVFVDYRINDETDYSFNPHESAVNLSRLNNNIKIYYIKEKETFSLKDDIPCIDGNCYTLNDECQYINSNHYDYIIHHGYIYIGIDKNDNLGHDRGYNGRKKMNNEGSK